ncbi:MaoC/PaaZ C-terminal domain-containing protein [Thermaerobacillus caldiproteolyticus]|uniref:Acyl dehydratase n=1 Tax=Thermaerobacillus caldiproteolyticus TaxID=247480 RepID=A0A7V9Z495_9BACL|nr:MaoC/PaaZ C-terminal domain-containing protein [Anoxybacillus caldiproteolyticus]MBA2873782.1 acyl dehydratase [Anoxybacillus caldiproteolyticus]QPA30341.1 enoyl-CoA hydratase [Anoxybacillus caldiproteolyticus]
MLKKRKLGRNISEITVGEKLVINAKIEDKDLLLYLGLTDDANPLYIQHDYASQTPLKKPIVPAIMLTGMITSAISKYLPGPGSHITKQEIHFLKPVYHYEQLQFLFEVKHVNEENHCIDIDVQALRDEKEKVLEGTLSVCPPYVLSAWDSRVLENF